MKFPGLLSKKLFDRAINYTRKSNTPEEPYEYLHNNTLISSNTFTTKVDGSMLLHIKPIVKIEVTYSSISFCEQHPGALA